jgi:hypothetical protein
MNALQPEAASETHYWSFAIIGGIIITITTMGVAVAVVNAILKKRQRKHNY